MAMIKHLLPALAIVSAAAAAICSIEATSTTTISNPAGASALASCSTYSGNVALATGAGGDKATVNLDGLQEIVGSLSYQNDDSVTTFQASQLTKMQDMSLGNLTKLPTLNMPALSEVRDLNITGLSTMGSLGFGSPGISKCRNLLITNTVLNTLAGISNLTQVEGFNIVNNPYLSEVVLSVAFIKGAVDIGANDPQGGGQSINFPKLESAGQLTFRNASKVSLPSLANVSQNLGLYDNTFETFGTPLLTFAGGIVLVENQKLTNISMPLLTTINGTNGTYQIANNTKLKSIDGFEELSVVKGGLDFSGNFSSVILTKLSNVGGAMNVQTSANFDCSKINGLGSSGSQVVKGAITCAGSQSTPGGAGTTPSASGAASASSGAAVPIDIPTFLGGTSLLAGLLQLLL